MNEFTSSLHSAQDFRMTRFVHPVVPRTPDYSSGSPVLPESTGNRVNARSLPFTKSLLESRPPQRQPQRPADLDPDENIPEWVGTPADVSGFPRVVDADTLDMDGQSIRLFGIDAPELSQKLVSPDSQWFYPGQEASDWLSDYIEGNRVFCDYKGGDKYGRQIGVCFVPAINAEVNADLVANGYAFAYRRYSKDYVELENEALRAQVGLWRFGEGIWKGNRPEQYRKRKR